MTTIQKTGLGIFIIGLLIFTIVLGLDSYKLTEGSIREAIGNEYHSEALVNIAKEKGMLDRSYGSSFAFEKAFKSLLEDTKAALDAKAKEGLPEDVKKSEYTLASRRFKDYTYVTIKKSNTGPVADNPLLFLFLTVGLGVIGGIIYILPKFNAIPGIKHNGIYHNAMERGSSLSVRAVFLALTIIGVLLYGVYYMNDKYFWPTFTAILILLIIGLVLFAQNQAKRAPARSASPGLTGWLGVLMGGYLIGFYVLLYWSPQHLTSWIIMVDPISKALNGGEASQWFLYGFLYTLIILVMGVRMFAKYMHNRYQIIRTISVMFFQTAFAFLIPEILVRLNYPYYDFKNIWPLNYTFFFDWNLNSLIQSGALGTFMLVWGIVLIVIGVPVITYFYGKRWYCSWVCGCGGLAETLGDPYRQLSDKSLRAWHFERWIIHFVLVFAVIMTMGVLYSYLPDSAVWYNRSNFLILMIVGLSGAMGYAYFRWRRGKVDISRLGIGVGIGATALIVGISVYHLATDSANFMFMNSNTVRTWYGFIIGSAFAGVVGTGFYPVMGNRVWCRFGCPLAAYLGLVQRFKSKFRITTNGGQCISCGNCSTYCEMGIDVRWYAQRGQDIVRSSCVGCGVCSAVCPRGVLRLENNGDDISERTSNLRAIHISENDVKILA